MVAVSSEKIANLGENANSNLQAEEVSLRKMKITKQKHSI